jgi:hypothetical protein
VEGCAHVAALHRPEQDQLSAQLEDPFRELALDVQRVTSVEGVAEYAEAVVVSVDAEDSTRWEYVPLKTEIPLVAVIAGTSKGVEEAEPRLTMVGYHECIWLEGLTPTLLRRALRRALVRTQSVPTISTIDSDPGSGPCPSGVLPTLFSRSRT